LNSSIIAISAIFSVSSDQKYPKKTTEKLNRQSRDKVTTALLKPLPVVTFCDFFHKMAKKDITFPGFGEHWK
jgi:hypothetical protein